MAENVVLIMLFKSVFDRLISVLAVKSLVVVLNNKCYNIEHFKALFMYLLKKNLDPLLPPKLL